MAEKLKFAGVPVYMNGQNYYIPSLSMRDFVEHYEFLTVAPKVDDQASFAARYEKQIALIGLAIRQNYPTVTDAELKLWLPIDAFLLALKAVQNASGLTAVTEGE